MAQNGICVPPPVSHHCAARAEARAGDHQQRAVEGRACDTASCNTYCILQPFSQKSRTATVPKVFPIGLCGVVEADMEHFWDSWSVGVLGERLCTVRSRYKRQLIQLNIYTIVAYMD